MIKSKETTDPSSCLSKAADDEPLFVLRASDRLAPRIVRVWAMFAEWLGTPAPKIREAFECADAMENWARAKRNGGKVPD